MKDKKLLLHACCAPCSVKCIDVLRGESIEPTLFFYNPNIHPYTEYMSRQNTLSAYAEAKQAELIISGEYGLRTFLSNTVNDIANRCLYCYRERLFKTAEYAAQNAFEAFSTTLLISPYQNHALIAKTAAEAAEKYGVTFLYRDFRPYFREGQALARETGLYMQKYCGCIFSEEERYLKNPSRS
ncbi:MAG: epoxyqueuosine reductase QueH [Clostridiales bacterium]|jgi:predicted adenine nucleotide alpha hydrolase (AANH) superfamily ATPase|nr:epoxyqueuosine reductase QueH [Clostridiales bacterium]